MNKIYIYQGAEFTEEQVIAAAQGVGMSFEEYLKKYDIKQKPDGLGKEQVVEPGAPAADTTAPESLDLTLTDTTSVLPEIETPEVPKTDTTADTLAITEEEQEQSKNIVSTLTGRTARGILNTAADVASIPETLIYSGAAIFNPDMTATEKIAFKNFLSNPSVGPIGVSSDNLRKAAENLSPLIKKYDDKDIYTAIDNGNYLDAAEMIVGGALESAPSIAAAYGGWGTVAVFGAGLASRKFDEELRANPDEALYKIGLNSLFTGANEAAGELLTRKLLFGLNILRKTGAADQAREFLDKSLKSLFKQYGVKPVGEGFSESITEIINVIIDKATLEKDITWPELRNQLVEAFTVGAFTGGVVTTVTDNYANPMSRELAENILMPTQTQFELRDKLGRFSNIAYDLQNSQDPIEQQALQDMLAEEEQAIIDIKNRNKAQIASLQGDNLSEYAKNRDQIYKLGDINNKEETSPLIRSRNTEVISRLNKRNDDIIKNSIDEAYEQQISSVQDYARSIDNTVKEFTSQESFDNYIDQRKNEKKVRLGTQGVYFPSSNEIVINKSSAIESLNVNAPAHELLHAVMQVTIKNGEPNAKAFADSVFDLLIEKTKDERFSDTEFMQRLQLYAQQLKYGGKNLDQEVLTLFNDALVTGDITLSDSKLSELGSMLRRSFYSLGFKRKFNKPQDVYNFLVDFNNSIRKGYIDKSVVRIAKEGATGRMISKDDDVEVQVDELLSQSRQELIDANKKILADAGGAQNLTEEQKALIKENVAKIKRITEGIEVKPVEGVKTESIERSEKTQKLYKEKGINALFDIAEVNAPFINKVVNDLFKTYPGFKEQVISKEDFKQTLIVGTSKRPSNSLLGLLKSYREDTGQTVMQYVMANLKNRGKGILDEQIGTQATTGSLDIGEDIDIAAEQELLQAPFKARRRAVSLSLPKTFIDKVYKYVKKDIRFNLPLYYTRGFKTMLEQRFRARFTQKLRDDILPVDGKPRKSDRLYTEYVNKNIRAMYELFTLQRVRASTAGNLRDFLYEDGKLKPFEEVKDGLLEYYIAPKSKISQIANFREKGSPNLKSQHRKQFAELLGEAIGFEAASDVLKTDPEIARIVKKEQTLLLYDTQLDFDKDQILNNVISVIEDRIRNINFETLDSAARQRIRKISRVARKLEQVKDKMSIIEINNFIIEEFGLDYVAAFNMVDTQVKLLKYAQLSDEIDRDKLKELYDEAYDAVNLKVVYKKGKNDNYNKFDEFYRKVKDIEEDEELYSMTRKEIIESLNRHGILPDNYRKMSKGELDDFYNNKTEQAKEEQVEKQKIVRTELDQKFNEILEETEGIDADKVFSEAEAVMFHKWKRKISNFSIIPPHAEDFVGLLYKTLAKGKKGEKQFEFYKENLLDKFNEATFLVDKFKNGILLKHNNLLKTLPAYKGLTKFNKRTNAEAYLNEQLEGTVVSRQNAVRLYLWRQNGSLTVPGDTDTDGKKLGEKANIQDVTVKQLNDILNAIKKDKTLLKYAETVKTYTKRLGPDGNQVGYTNYDPNWLGGNVGIDLIDYANGEKRTEFLSEWQNNIDQIFNKGNLAKLQALYGIRYRRALEHIIKRMKSGRNRSISDDSIGARWLDFINGSVGNIMFLNIRSAALQSISSINYLNWSDNNLYHAGKAFVNQKQYWKDFIMLLNSDFLVARRGGLKMDISADEIALAATNKNGFIRAIAKLGKLGFIPTQMMDSVAISVGGAAFYRNRLNRYIKEGLTESKAKEKAMYDFMSITEESQQSSRPDRISQAQASTIAGRLVLSFANTSMQYARLLKKSTLDLANGRGNQVENISKIAYYGAVQAIIFNFLQNAVLPWTDDEEEPDKKDNIKRALNGIIDGHLRGIGIGGIAAYEARAIYAEYEKQQESNRKKPLAYALPALAFAPPLQSKIRNLVQAARLFTYKQELDKMEKLGYKLTPEQIINPRWMSYALGIQAATSLPTARILTKMQNIYLATQDDLNELDRTMLLMGWDRWTLDLVKKPQPEGYKSIYKKSYKSIYK